MAKAKHILGNLSVWCKETGISFVHTFMWYGSDRNRQGRIFSLHHFH